MYNWKDIVRFDFKDHVLEVPLYFKTRESSQIVTFLLVGMLSGTPGLEITHYIFAAHNFVKMEKGHFIQKANNRHSRENSYPGMRCSSTYFIKNPKTGEIETVEFTFQELKHMKTLLEYFPHALNKHFVKAKHYYRKEYGGDWLEVDSPYNLAETKKSIYPVQKAAKPDVFDAETASSHTGA